MNIKSGEFSYQAKRSTWLFSLQNILVYDQEADTCTIDPIWPNIHTRFDDM